MKRKWSWNPFFRIFAFLCVLVLLAAGAAVGLFYYVFSIPEPMGLSLASWPETFTNSFTVWLANEDGRLEIEEVGLKRLDEYGLWMQVLDESGREVFSHNKPAGYPGSYSASQLTALGSSAYENGSTVFVNSFEDSGETWSYLIGFPYAVGKYMVYYNGETVSRLSPVFRMVIVSAFLAAAAAFLVYGFWLTRQMGRITKGVANLFSRSYKPLPEKGIFSGVYESLNQMDLALRRSDRLREDTERARREWIANITHDLKTPLSPVKGYAEFLAHGSVAEGRDVRECGAIILKNVNHAERLINDLKLTYQLDSGAVPFCPRQVRLVRFLRELVIDVANTPAFSDRDIAFESSLPEFTAAVDPDLLRRAVENLVVNALVHNPPDTRVRVSVSAGEEKGVRISILDNGVGMSAAEQAELFTRYYRGTSTREKPEGSGLGLAIAKQIVTLHGGSISVESRPGEGTAFLVNLPGN